MLRQTHALLPTVLVLDWLARRRGMRARRQALPDIADEIRACRENRRRLRAGMPPRRRRPSAMQAAAKSG